MNTLSSFGIAIARSPQIDVVVAVTLLARATRFVRIAEEVVVARIALHTRMAGITVADDVVSAGHEGALGSVGVTGGDGVGATARSAAYFTSKQRISVETFNALVAVVASGEILTLITFSSFRVASGGVAIAVTSLTIREVPVADLTLITLSAVCLRVTITLTSHQVAFIVFRSDAVAITSLATVG